MNDRERSRSGNEISDVPFNFLAGHDKAKMSLNPRLHQWCAVILGGVAGTILGFSTGHAVLGTVVALLVSGTALLCSTLAGFPAEPKVTPADDVLPEYIYSAFDGLPEGILVLDSMGRIRFGNPAFQSFTGVPVDGILDQRGRDLPWQWSDVDLNGEVATPVPWIEAVRSGESRRGQLLGPAAAERSLFKLRAFPIAMPGSKVRGALCCFEDISSLQKKEVEKETLLKAIRESSNEIRRQNAQLGELLVRDPISGCFNRKVGFDALDRIWLEAVETGGDVACVLVDVDQFGSLNEQFGREVGERVLRDIGTALLKISRSNDVVFRYGGDEFLVLLPQTSLGDATSIAERMRQSVVRLQSSDVSLSVSLGVAARTGEERTPHDLIEQAEHHTRQAKSRGGNQVIKESARPTDAAGSSAPRDEIVSWAVIPFPAVTALICALAYRDQATAAHSRRVADLSLLVGQRMMSSKGCYLLETAALLHDIGKVGVPDALLHKETALTEAERQEIQAHSSKGLEIVRAAFGAPELSAILESARVPFSKSLETQNSLPLGARILAIADAYDSMINHQTYRPALSPANAVLELQRCAGDQFDPEIVAQFIELVNSRSSDSPPKILVDRTVALTLGLQMERLAEAIDQHDIKTLESLSDHLIQLSSLSDELEIAERAQELKRGIQGGNDQLGIFRLANDLLNYCRATQAALLDHPQISGPPDSTFQPATEWSDK